MAQLIRCVMTGDTNGSVSVADLGDGTAQQVMQHFHRLGSATVLHHVPSHAGLLNLLLGILISTCSMLC